MSTARWAKYKDWSGIVIRGEVPFVAPPDSLRHMHRAVWLTSQLEGAHFGTVQSYDGAGISAGLLHNVAVLPKSMDQGDLWQLVGEIIRVSERGDYRGNYGPVRLSDRLLNKRWVVREDGVLRHVDTGLSIKGYDIRNEIAPPGGVVPRKGDYYGRAVAWAQLFHEAFADPATHGVQVEHAVRWLSRGQRDLELTAYLAFLRRGEVPLAFARSRNLRLDSAIGLMSDALLPEVDLAMCVYHAFSVNGPAPAATALRAALRGLPPAEKFARTLIRKLGKSTYGAWQDEPGEGTRSRYDRTRRAVWGSSLWDSAMAKALMPRDL
jgi:hypothetical protein